MGKVVKVQILQFRELAWSLFQIFPTHKSRAVLALL